MNQKLAEARQYDVEWYQGSKPDNVEIVKMVELSAAQEIIEGLEAETSQLKARNWVLKDSQLRTYDGLSERAAKADELEKEIRAWQDTFDIEMNLAEHQRFRYNTTAKDAGIIFEQRRSLKNPTNTVENKEKP